jgi:hypothetical protein
MDVAVLGKVQVCEGQRDAVNLLTSCQYERVVFGNLLGLETASLLI